MVCAFGPACLCMDGGVHRLNILMLYDVQNAKPSSKTKYSRYRLLGMKPRHPAGTFFSQGFMLFCLGTLPLHNWHVGMCVMLITCIWSLPKMYAWVCMVASAAVIRLLGIQPQQIAIVQDLQQRCCGGCSMQAVFIAPCVHVRVWPHVCWWHLHVSAALEPQCVSHRWECGLRVTDPLDVGEVQQILQPRDCGGPVQHCFM